jgi:hypothetical protein
VSAPFGRVSERSTAPIPEETVGGIVKRERLAERSMPLDDREQRILDEIERQFYQEDPKLAETVRKTTFEAVSKRNLTWAILGLVVGVGLMLGFFTSITLVALVGFVLMVLCVAWIVAIVRQRTGAGLGAAGALAGRLRRGRQGDR